MKIAFLNGSLEPGRDGVGDYTHSLAKECIRQGQQCCIIALNDRWLTTPKCSDDNDLKTLRLPGTLVWPERIRLAREMLDDFEPDWISLQFVPYAFNQKGIIYGLSAKLKPLLSRSKLHIMFHELWLGEAIGTRTKERLVGIVQRHAILAMLRQRSPTCIHTSIALYIDILKSNKISAICLPLFGSLPIAEHNGDEWIFPLLQKVGASISINNREDFWLFGFFGTIQHGWNIEFLLKMLNLASRRANRKIVFLSIGRIGADDTPWENLQHTAGNEFVCLKLGEHTAEKVSQYLLSMDFGLSAYPYNLAGKSSVIASMREHGLPVIVLRQAIQPKIGVLPYPDDRLILPLDANLTNRFLNGIHREAPKSKLHEIAITYLNALKQSMDYDQEK